MAPTPERSPATCQLVNDAHLIAAPPVENSSAALTSLSRAVVLVSMWGEKVKPVLPIVDCRLRDRNDSPRGHGRQRRQDGMCHALS